MHKSGQRHRAFCRFCGALIPPTRTVCRAHEDLPAIEAELRGDGRERIMLTDADAVGSGRGRDGADRA